jgi:HD superfamily phosphohydrolase
MELKTMIDCLSDIGVDDEHKEMLRLIMESGQKSELIGYLKRCRCTLMDEMHESQRKVDRMDYLIRWAEKEAIK